MIKFKTVDNSKTFTSAWTYLTDKDNLPCEGNISFQPEGVVCKSRKKLFRLNLLFKVREFGEVVMQTKLHRNNNKTVLLETSLLEGRLDQIQKVAEKSEFEKAKQIKQIGLEWLAKNNLSRFNDTLAELLHFGEEIALKRAQKQRPKKKVTFGCQAFRIDSIKENENLLKKTFNFAVVPTYFFMTRPERGTFDFSRADRLIKTLKKSGFRIKAHPLVWLHKYSTPEWIKQLSFDELKTEITKHVQTTVNHFKGKVDIWDITNEFHSNDANGQKLNINQLIDLTKLISEEVTRIDPSVHKILNFSEIFGAGSSPGENTPVPMETFLDLCVAKNVKFEGIGFQMYMGLKKEFTCRELLNISLFLDRFERFNKDLHLTELGFPSEFKVDPDSFFESDHPAAGGFWHQEWNEDIQADFLDKLIKIFVSKPRAKSITWWDLQDSGKSKDISSKFFPFAGLLRKDGSQKQAFQTIQNWKNKLNINQKAWKQ